MKIFVVFYMEVSLLETHLAEFQPPCLAVGKETGFLVLA